MKSFLRIMMFTFLVSIFFQGAVYANAVIDRSNIANGLVSVRYTGPAGRDIRILVEKGGERYTYIVNGSSIHTVPLQMGTGTYTVTVVEGVGGNRFRPLQSETLTVNQINTNNMFSASIIQVDFAASSRAVPHYKSLVGAQVGQARVKTVYNDLVNHFSYDHAKARSVQAGYVPVLDTVFAAQKGICFDYAALFAGALRSQGVPTKLVMGYAPDIEEYHAWNEVLIDGEWVVVDTTFDSQLVAANRTATFAKNGALYRIIRVY